MKITASPANPNIIEQDMLAVFYFEDKETSSFSALKDKKGSFIESLIDKKLIKPTFNHITPLIGHTDLSNQHVLIIGCGKSEDFKEAAFIKTIKAVAKAAKDSSVTSIAFSIDDIKPEARTLNWCGEKATEILMTSLYQYDATKSKKADPIALAEIAFHTNEPNIDLAIKTGKAIAHGVNVARELGNLPANICDPTFLAEHANNLADAYDEIEVEIVEEIQMAEMGMGSYLAVSQGSDKPAKLIVIKYNGGSSDQKPHVLVGKGLTFDSGGICLKPPAGMEEMKYDMLGAASVFGTMSTIAELKPAINVVGVIAAAENMINGSAVRPGDVVTCMNGKTIEIINTDAEGRLVLCDTLTFVERFEPVSVIDIATLTGAVVVGLGHHATAVYSNDEDFQQQILGAGKASWDRGWPMPLWDEYSEELKTPYADFRNVGSKAGGSITAALFLSEFAKNYKWAHLDIAGTGWSNAKEGASGRPVGMLTQYLLDRIT